MHQIQFARSVASEARVVEPEDLKVAVAEHLDPPTIVDPERRSRAFAGRLSEVMADLLGPVPIRDRQELEAWWPAFEPSALTMPSSWRDRIRASTRC